MHVKATLITRSLKNCSVPLLSITRIAKKPDIEKNKGIRQLLMKRPITLTHSSAGAILSIPNTFAKSGAQNNIGACMTKPIIIAKALKKSKLWYRCILFPFNWVIYQTKWPMIKDCKDDNCQQFHAEILFLKADATENSYTNCCISPI